MGPLAIIRHEPRIRTVDWVLVQSAKPKKWPEKEMPHLYVHNLRLSQIPFAPSSCSVKRLHSRGSNVLLYVRVLLLAEPSRRRERPLTMPLESHPEVGRVGATRPIQLMRAYTMIKAAW
jgi:hypothetical protein